MNAHTRVGNDSRFARWFPIHFLPLFITFAFLLLPSLAIDPMYLCSFLIIDPERQVLVRAMMCMLLLIQH